VRVEADAKKQASTVDFLKAKAVQLSEENKRLRMQMAQSTQQQRHSTSFSVASPPPSVRSSPIRARGGGYAPSSPGLGASYDDFTLRSRDTGLLDRSTDRCGDVLADIFRG
jgi:hypothetical protein